jgi:methionyl-tRNA formyltransferase
MIVLLHLQILQEVQLEGRKKMSGREFLNGFRKILNIK